MTQHFALSNVENHSNKQVTANNVSSYTQELSLKEYTSPIVRNNTCKERGKQTSGQVIIWFNYSIVKEICVERTVNSDETTYFANLVWLQL